MRRSDRTGMPEGALRDDPRWRFLAGSPFVLAVAITGCAPNGAMRWERQPGVMTRPAPAYRRGDEVGGETIGSLPLPRPRADRLQGIKDRSDDSLRPASAPPDDLPPAIAPKTPRPLGLQTPAESVPTGEVVTAIPPADHGEFPIDLDTALRLAESENPVIAEARVRISEALAIRQQARSMLLPSLNMGFNYHGHVGDLQRSSGRILSLSEQSVYVGGGAGATAAGSIGLDASQVRDIRFPVSLLANNAPDSVPAVNIYSQLADAFYMPLVARQMVAAARFGAAATANRVLLEVAEFHLELIAADAELAYRRETARQAAEVARLTRAYADAQQGRAADADRALTELRLVRREVLEAEEQVAVTSTRLVRRLHLDPNVRLHPVAPALDPITLVDPMRSLPELLDIGLRRRPEVGANEANVSRAELRRRQEVHRPLLPTFFLGFSGGAFGGGSNLALPTIGNFAGRSDFDVGVFWTAENLGLGNLAHVRRRRAELGQAIAERSLAFAEIRTEVSKALADVLATRPQLEITGGQLRSAEAGFAEDLTRIRNVVGRPVEVVNSLKLLNDARIARVRAITEYNKAQVRLYVALGSPPPLEGSAKDPLPPAPIASPPVGPLGVALH